MMTSLFSVTWLQQLLTYGSYIIYPPLDYFEINPRAHHISFMNILVYISKN